jgi:hypothetical protein
MSAAPDFRDYDPARRDRIALAMWKGVLQELNSDGVVVLPSRELMDASALMLGMVLASSPTAAIPSQMRELCQAHAKLIIRRTGECRSEVARTGKWWDGVITEEDRIQ